MVQCAAAVPFAICFSAFSSPIFRFIFGILTALFGVQPGHNVRLVTLFAFSHSVTSLFLRRKKKLGRSPAWAYCPARYLVPSFYFLRILQTFSLPLITFLLSAGTSHLPLFVLSSYPPPFIFLPYRLPSS